MASNYPGSLDSFPTNHTSGQVISSAEDNDTNDAINKIEAELGVNPSGSYADITARLAALSNAGVATFQRQGTLTTGSGTLRWPFPTAASITGVIMAVSTAPTGASIIVDVNKGTSVSAASTIFTTQSNRPTILASAFATASAAVPDIIAFAAGDYLTVDIDQVGSTVAGVDLTIQVSYI